jgi:hypothetical protein
LPASNLDRWRRLQQQLAPSKRSYAEVTLMLAYYGADYQANLERLKRPYGDWRESLAAARAAPHGYERAGNAAVNTVHVPDDMGLLFAKRHDSATLRFLLDMKTDGAIAESQSDVLESLWPANRAMMLRTASGSPPRLRNLADALAWDADSPADTRATLKELTRFLHSRDPQIAGAARQVVALVRQQRRRGASSRPSAH